VVQQDADFIWIDDESWKADFPYTVLALLGLAIQQKFQLALYRFSFVVFLLHIIGQVDEYMVKVMFSEVISIRP